jgi:Flp pilus assembly protein TadB
MVHKTKQQNQETDNIGYTRRSNKTKKLTTYGTQDEAKKQRNWQHRVHKTKQKNQETDNIGYTRRSNKTKSVPMLSVSLFFCFVLCTLCCQFLGFVASSCVPYVVSFLVLLLRLVYPMLSVSWFFCFVLCTVCCQIWTRQNNYSTV